MPRVLVRSGKDPRQALGAEASLARNGWGVFGANIGNFLFTSSVHRALSVPGTDVVSNSLLTELPGTNEAYVQRINDEFDAFAIPLANAFRPQFTASLNRLSEVIEQLAIPAVVVGVGTQLLPQQSLDDVPDEVNSAAKRFATAVLDRSASIGVRGEITKDYLLGLGFPDDAIEVIGCPSLFDSGPGLRVEKRLAGLQRDSSVSINITPSVSAIYPVLERAMAEFPELVYLPQEHWELASLLWGENVPPGAGGMVPSDTRHPLYRDGKVKFFLDASTWIDYLSRTDFSFGTRIHGNIAALAAGTPAYLLSHDSRTLELARYHSIPHRRIASADETVGAAALYEEADFSAFNSAMPDRFERYTRFLESNGLEHVFQSGKANPDWDAELVAADLPAPVLPLSFDSGSAAEAAYSRLRWLRQGNGADKNRRIGGYVPPFAPEAAAPTRNKEPKTDQRQLVALEQRVEALTAELNSLRTRSAAQEKRLKETERMLDRVRSSVPARAVRKVKRVIRGGR